MDNQATQKQTDYLIKSPPPIRRASIGTGQRAFDPQTASYTESAMPALFFYTSQLLIVVGNLWFADRYLILLTGCLLAALAGAALWCLAWRELSWRFISLSLHLMPRGTYAPYANPELNDFATDNRFLLHHPKNRGSPLPATT